MSTNSITIGSLSDSSGGSCTLVLTYDTATSKSTNITGTNTGANPVQALVVGSNADGSVNTLQQFLITVPGVGQGGSVQVPTAGTGSIQLRTKPGKNNLGGFSVFVGGDLQASLAALLASIGPAAAPVV